MKRAFSLTQGIVLEFLRQSHPILQYLCLQMSHNSQNEPLDDLSMFVCCHQPPAGAPHRCRRRQHAISGLLRAIRTTSRVRALRSFLPVQAAVPDAGPLHCNSTHMHAPPCCKQPCKSTMGFAHLRTWPREPRARRLACVPAGGVKATRNEKAW